LTLLRNPSLLVTVAPPAKHQDEIPAQRAIHFFDVVHIDQAGAADAQHGLGAQRQFRLLQGAAGVEAVLADPDTDIVAVRLDHLHLRGLEHVQWPPNSASRRGRSSPGGRLPRSSCAKQTRQQRLALVAPTLHGAAARAKVLRKRS
jgi:hypothetical protein